MQPSDRKKFLEIVLGFAELKGKQLSAPALELYWNSMQAWSLEDFQAAANQLIRTTDWMPTPKHFEDLRKAGRPTAAEAFAKAIGWARDGSYTTPARSPEAILIDRVVASLGGWIAITSYDQEKLHFLEKRFAENYEMIEDASDTREALPQIAGPLHPRLAAGLKRLTSARPALEAAKS